MDTALSIIAQIQHVRVGAVLATCCHGKIEEGKYVGSMEYLQASIGLEARDFSLLTHVSAWATLNVSAEGALHCADTGLTRSERRAVGTRAKTVLDLARVHQLNSGGMLKEGCVANLLHYTSPEVTLENRCIVICQPII